jgi:hypothetical protein
MTYFSHKITMKGGFDSPMFCGASTISTAVAFEKAPCVTRFAGPVSPSSRGLTAWHI